MGASVHNEVNVPIQLTHIMAKMPVYSTAEAAGADLHALLPDGPVTIEPGHRLLISTGVIIELPSAYEAQIRSRSGLALKAGVHVLNAPGTIDADYRGVIGIILQNSGQLPFTVENGDRIAQMVIAPVVTGAFSVVEEMSASERGAGGFGSTGVSSDVKSQQLNAALETTRKKYAAEFGVDPGETITVNRLDYLMALRNSVLLEKVCREAGDHFGANWLPFIKSVKL